MNAPLITKRGLHRVDFPACTANACGSGRKSCPCPDACLVPEESAGSLLVSRWVWIGAVLSVIAWGLVAGFIL